MTWLTVVTYSCCLGWECDTAVMLVHYILNKPPKLE